MPLHSTSEGSGVPVSAEVITAQVKDGMSAEHVQEACINAAAIIVN